SHTVAIVNDELDRDAVAVRLNVGVSGLWASQSQNEKHDRGGAEPGKQPRRPGNPAAHPRCGPSHTRESGCATLARVERAPEGGRENQEQQESFSVGKVHAEMTCKPVQVRGAGVPLYPGAILLPRV